MDNTTEMIYLNGYHTILQEENLKNGLWSQYVNNHLGFPEEYYDNFLWRKGYSYNNYFNGGNPTGFTPYLVRYSMRWQYGEYRMNYYYDSGNRLSIRNNGYLSHKKTYNYDTNGLLSNLTYTGHTAFPDIDIDFTRDDSGLITAITGDKELNVNYNSDLEIEGVQHILPQPFNESYTYDTRGNRLTSLTNAYTYNDLNQLTSTTTHTYSYDADGNLIEERNKITTETKKYFYNSENRLTGFEHYPTDASPADIIATYNYDIYGRRLQKNVNGNIINFSWEGDNLALEMDANYQPIRRYVYGFGKDDVEGYVEISEITGGMFDQSRQGWYSYIKDQVGTIYKVYSDNAKQIVDTRTYDTFGNLINRTGTSTGNLGFQGKYYDPESGLYYFYNRYYNPSNGRFINEDPIGFNGGLNFYSYGNNNSLMFVDPYGLVTGRFSTIDRPSSYRRLIEMGGSRSVGGATFTFTTLYPKKCECINGKWYPRFHFDLKMIVYYTWARDHEYRHVSDMRNGYRKARKLLSSGEERGYSSEVECLKNAMDYIDPVIWIISTTNRKSIIWRDILWW